MGQDSKSDEPLVLVLCPECQSGVWTNAKRCWLCGHAMDSPFKGQAQGKVPGGEHRRSNEWQLNLALAIMGVSLVLVTVGVWMQEPIWGVCLAVVLLPAVGITLAWGAVARMAGKPLSAAKRLGVFLTSALVTFAVATVTAAVAITIAVMVVIAAIIALFEACFKMLGGG